MRKFILSIAVISLVACNNNEETVKPEPVKKDSTPMIQDSASAYIHTFADTALESKITKTLLQLPFVKKSNAYIDSISSHEHGIAFMLDSVAPNRVDVTAGYNGKERFETYYLFQVNPKTMDVKIDDPVTGKLLTPKQFVQQQ